jgi:hypothetical protein
MKLQFFQFQFHWWKMKRKLCQSTVKSKKLKEEFKFEEFESNIHKTTTELLLDQISKKITKSEIISIIPNEILHIILEYSNSEDIKNISSVCSHWLFIILSNRYNKERNRISLQNFKLEAKITEMNFEKIEKKFLNKINTLESVFEKWKNWKQNFSLEDLQRELQLRNLKTKGGKEVLKIRLNDALPVNYLENISQKVKESKLLFDQFQIEKSEEKVKNPLLNRLPMSSIYFERKNDASIHVVSSKNFCEMSEEKIYFHSTLEDAYLNSNDFDVILLSPGFHYLNIEINKSLEFIGNGKKPLDVVIKASSYSIQTARVKFCNLSIQSGSKNPISTNFMNLKEWSSVEFNYCDISMENSFDLFMNSNSTLVIQHSIVHDSLRGAIKVMNDNTSIIIDNCSFSEMRMEKDENNPKCPLISLLCLNEPFLKISNHIKVRSCNFQDEDPIFGIVTYGGSNLNENIFNIEKNEKYEKIFHHFEKSIHVLDCKIHHIKIYEKEKEICIQPASSLPSNDNLICECGSLFEELNSENETVKIWTCKHSKCIIGHFTKPIQISKSESENEKSCSHWFCRAKAFKISVDFLKNIEKNVNIETSQFETNLFELRLCENGHLKMFVNDDE